MGAVIDAPRLRSFMQALGSEARDEARIFFTGGATAVLLGWRPLAIDVDLKILPATAALADAIRRQARVLDIELDFLCPADYLPELPGWEARSPLVERAGRLAFHHYDLGAQALAKIARGHAGDVADVREILVRGLVEPARLREIFRLIEPQLAGGRGLHPASLRKALEEALRG